MLKISFCIKKITDVSVLSNKIKLLTKCEDLICSWKKAILVTICYCNTQNLRKPINLYCDNVVSRGFPSLINMFTGKCEQTHENGQNLLRGNNMMLSMFRRIFVPFFVPISIPVMYESVHILNSGHTSAQVLMEESRIWSEYLSEGHTNTCMYNISKSK